MAKSTPTNAKTYKVKDKKNGEKISADGIKGSGSKKEGKVDLSKPCGTIKVTLYKTKPHEVKFDGNITGRDLLQCIKYIRKNYRLWKGEVYRKLKKQGGK